MPRVIYSTALLFSPGISRSSIGADPCFFVTVGYFCKKTTNLIIRVHQRHGQTDRQIPPSTDRTDRRAVKVQRAYGSRVCVLYNIYTQLLLAIITTGDAEHHGASVLFGVYAAHC